MSEITQERCRLPLNSSSDRGAHQDARDKAGSQAASVAVAAGPAAAAAAVGLRARPEFTVELKSLRASQDQRDQVVPRESTGLGPQGGKDRVEGAPEGLKDRVNKADSAGNEEEARRSGAKVELTVIEVVLNHASVR